MDNGGLFVLGQLLVVGERDVIELNLPSADLRWLRVVHLGDPLVDFEQVKNLLHIDHGLTDEAP